MLRVAAASLLLLVASISAASAQEIRRLSLAATWSLQRSGMLNVLLLAFQTETGIRVQFNPATEAAPFEAGRQGNADVLLVSDPAEIERFIGDGFGADARPVFYTDFVLVGPESDPAQCLGAGDVTEAFRRIAATGHRFVSRGDGSLTHQREMHLWRSAGIDLANVERSWYRPVGLGARATLEAAAQEVAYALVSRATWVRLKPPNPLKLLVEGDPRLVSPVTSVRVDPKRFEFVHDEEARAWNAWLLSTAAQAEVANFRMDGQRVYFPIAERPSLTAPPVDAAELRAPRRPP
jgi:tungstate transport system substrate-binding protein